MKLSVLIGLLEDTLAKYSEGAPKPQASNYAQNKTYYIYLESQLSFRLMQGVINELKKFNGNDEVRDKHTKIVTDFLSSRWDRVKSTNAIYSIELTSHANLMCIAIAEFLAMHLKDFVGDKSYFALLMPTISSWRSCREGVSNIDMKFMFSFLPTDDNKHCMEIGYLTESLNDDGSLVLKNQEGGKERKLSAAEVSRVRDHTKFTQEHFEGMMPLLKRYRDNKQAIADRRNTLRDALTDANYAKWGLQSSYGKAGEKLLNDNLLKHRNELFATREQLFDYMSVKLNQKGWSDFVASLAATPAEAKQHDALITKGGRVEKTTLSLGDLIGRDDSYVKAALFCLANTYWRDRDKYGQFTTFFAYVHRQAFDKQTKEKACNAVTTFLLTKPLSAWGEYIAELEQKDEQDKTQVAAAIKDGTVGSIHSLIEGYNQSKNGARKDASVSASRTAFKI